MVFHWKLIQTMEVFSPLDFGKVSKMLWGLVSPLAPPSILNQVVRKNESIKFWRICSELPSSLLVRIGRSAYHSPSSLITIVIKLAWAKLLSKFFMDENVERLLTGRKPARDNSLART